MIQTLHREQIIPARLDDVWRFFATPKNLNDLTPPQLKFVIVSPLPDRMRAGQLFEYRISIVPGIWGSWLTEIRHVVDREYFVDEQRIGPYRFWYHEHRFEAVADSVKMTDHVTYSIGLGPLGWLANKFWIRPKLERIFDYRRQAIDRIFSQSSSRS